MGFAVVKFKVYGPGFRFRAWRLGFGRLARSMSKAEIDIWGHMKMHKI